MFQDRDSLVRAIAGVRAPQSRGTQPTRSLILKTDGPDALLSHVFEEDLLNIERTLAIEQAEKDLESWLNQDFDIIPIYDERYPHRLKEVHQAPGIIFSCGAILPGDQGISVVGSRNASTGGLQAAKDIAIGLVSSGLTVVSGLAAGIDAAAHEAALDAGGRTVAIMGTSIEQTYPKENSSLRARIESSGQVITQFFPSTVTSPKNFPMRNATMSGYGAATIVVSAGEHSGTRHQANAAIRHGHALIVTPEVAYRTNWGMELLSSQMAQLAHSPEEATQLAIEAVEISRNSENLFS